MARTSLLFAGIFIAQNAFAHQAGTVIVTRGDNPGCYELANTGALAAIEDANENAAQQCNFPILRSLKIDVRQVGGCTPTVVHATYVCASHK
ncbi:MAG: hypothetical protein NTV34_01770 [Proteobacteria bacterium]|nr:hypothetical protein [Pseudomonadota bacterium]